MNAGIADPEVRKKKLNAELLGGGDGDLLGHGVFNQCDATSVTGGTSLGVSSLHKTCRRVSHQSGVV